MGIISGSGSLQGQFGDHFGVRDHFGVGIISGAVQVAYESGRYHRVAASIRHLAIFARGVKAIRFASFAPRGVRNICLYRHLDACIMEK